MKIQLILFSAILSSQSLVLSACASRSSAPLTQLEKFNTLQNGVTKDQEVRIVLGVPDASLTQGQTKTWVYRDKKGSPKPIYQFQGGQLQGLILVFNSEGVLKNHSFVNSDLAKNAKENKKSVETPIAK